MTRALSFLLLLIVWQVCVATDQFVNKACANNGDGTNAECAGAGGGAGAFNVASSCTAARGNTCFICGPYDAAYNPGGVASGDGVSYYTVDGNCPGNAGSMTVSTGAQMGIGGASRANIKVRNLTFTGGVTGINLTGHTSGGSNFRIQGNTFSSMSTAGVQLQPPADSTVSGIEISANTFADIGDGVYNNAAAAVSAAPVQQGVGVSSGLVTGLHVHDNVFRSSSVAKSLYGVSFKPPTNSATGGRVRASSIYRNVFIGTFAGHAIQVFTDSDETEVYENTFEGTFGGAVIHIGGQPDKNTTCGSTTDNTIVRDNLSVSGGVVSSLFTVDGAGIYPDECSVGTKVYRNAMYGNEVAGLYLNDSDGTRAVGNVIFGNGDNAIHVHGIGIDFVAYHNTMYHDADASGIADQGLDGVQIDAGVGTGTTLINNAVVCGTNTAKCVDADTTITESHNDIYSLGATRAEGFTPDATDKNEAPGWVGGDAPGTVDGFCLLPDSPLHAAGTYLGAWATGYDTESLGNAPVIGARGLCQARRAAESRRVAAIRRPATVTP